MSLQAPILLVALVALPLGLGLAALWRRRHPPPTLPFPDVDLVAAAAPRLRLRRRAPTLLVVAGLALGALALAGPRALLGPAAEDSMVMLVLDVSGSMDAADVEPTRLDAAGTAARRFIRESSSETRVGLITFADRVTLALPPSVDRRPIATALDRLAAYGSTAIGEALLGALGALREARDGPRGPGDASIVLLSDGANAVGVDPRRAAAEAHRAHVPIYTVALGEAIPPDPHMTRQTVAGGPRDPAALRALAAATGGRSYEIRDARSLRALYAGLGHRLGGGRREVSLSPVAAALAALLVLGGLAWGRRGLAGWPRPS